MIAALKATDGGLVITDRDNELLFILPKIVM